MKVIDLLKENDQHIVVCSRGESIVEASKSLTKASIGAMPVVDDDGLLVGIVSERDIVHGLAEHGHTAPSMTIDEIMTRDVITITSGTTTNTALELMSKHRIRHLPVVDGDSLLGIISIRDILSISISKAVKRSQQLRDLTG